MMARPCGYRVSASHCTSICGNCPSRSLSPGMTCLGAGRRRTDQRDRGPHACWQTCSPSETALQWLLHAVNYASGWPILQAGQAAARQVRPCCQIPPVRSPGYGLVASSPIVSVSSLGASSPEVRLYLGPHGHRPLPCAQVCSEVGATIAFCQGLGLCVQWGGPTGSGQEVS